MTILDSTVDGLREQNTALHDRLELAEETLRAIRSGEVDAIAVETPAGCGCSPWEGLTNNIA